MTSRNEFTLRDEEENLFLVSKGRRDGSYSYSYSYHEEIPDIMEQEASSFIRGENQTNRKKNNHVLLRDPQDYSRDEFLPSHISQPLISFKNNEEFKSQLNHSSSR
ncbi:predicted protein [Chaetoceros tenuissimus]|uniref:Uncharacterized protein n=1 Tax=Chaetoceros tenuissimus TaxID=426638 RepID=A0AAD3CKW4_9STRA|nr:predicted protein [Chaetoceros tenuissimus]